MKQDVLKSSMEFPSLKRKGFFHYHWLFPESIAAAHAAQQEMAQRIVLEDVFDKPIHTIAGMDVSNTPFDPEQIIFGAAVVFYYTSLEVLEIQSTREVQKFPYIPGLLGFREVPTLVHVWKKQTIGMMLRTKKNCNPLIISPGHKISLESAVTLVMSCFKKYRLPEPTRHAHIAANNAPDILPRLKPMGF
jgi:deoxyinosine 3'endonuclease (endonuclease V)